MSGTKVTGVSRREFGKLLGGAAVVVPLRAVLKGRAHGDPEGLPHGGPEGPPCKELQGVAGARDESFWRTVRDKFLLPVDLALMNAANLCPASRPVLEVLEAETRWVDRDPSLPNRRRMTEGRETTRKLLAGFLHATPEEIVITRNTSEGNNIVSSGLDLKAGDEVIVVSDNHPSLLNAWQQKAKRFGFSVRVIDQVNPHPGTDYYVDAFAKAMTTRTRVVAFSHVTASVGDLFPAKDLCRLARERGVLSIVDAAQSFGVLDIDLSDMQPDFFTGSAHKWPCGPREVGVLFIRRSLTAGSAGAQASATPAIWPSVVSLYAGAVGASTTFEGMGQRDDAAVMAFGEALKLQTTIGAATIERRSRELAQALIEGLKKIPGVKVWTHADPARSAAIVSFQPGGLNPSTLATTLYEKDRIAVMARGGADRGGLRVAPHFYNLHEEVERLVGAVARYVRMT
jgi:selenocysteine lyase/cysteine desulfurase